MTHSQRPLMRTVITLLAIATLFAIGLWGCSDADRSPLSPENKILDLASSADHPRIQAVMAVQDRHTEHLMASPGVIGTATTLDDDGQPAIMVLVITEAAKSAQPRTIEDIPVKVVLTDPIVAMGGPPGGGGTSHRGKQTPPIQLGTSGGWYHDLANGYCCGGTLGALIQVGSQKRILSNYHVFEADIVSGGNNRVAQTGDFVIQPALIDVNCNASNAQNVATLVVSQALPGSNVDASTATIISGMVSENGAILGIGTISSQTVGAAVGQKVKKSGRTTGLTRSSVDGLNASVSIAYENECAGGSAFTKTFTGQILIKNRRSGFLAGGDSGSLMVEDVSTNPRAIGLLFAGSSTIAVANPIGQVLSYFNASMVGN